MFDFAMVGRCLQLRIPEHCIKLNAPRPPADSRFDNAQQTLCKRFALVDVASATGFTVNHRDKTQHGHEMDATLKPAFGLGYVPC